MKTKFKSLSISIALILLISLVNTSILNVSAATNNIIDNPYPEVAIQNLEYDGENIVSPVLPYADYFSLYTKLPLAHTKSTGYGINIGVIGNDQYADFIYFIARDSVIYSFDNLSFDKIKNSSIDIVTIPSFKDYANADLKIFVENCISYNIPVLIEGDLALSDEEIKLVNELEEIGAISVGKLLTQNLGTYYDVGNVSKAINENIKEININVFAPEMFDNPWNYNNTKFALFGTVGAMALLIESNNEINTADDYKQYLINNSRNTWQSVTIDGKSFVEYSIEIDPINGFYEQGTSKDLFSYRILDFQKLLNIQIKPNWNVNIFNCYKAWDISTGNVDVAIIDLGFYSERTDIKNNIVEKKVVGDKPFDQYELWHGSQMAYSLLSIAPDAKIHAIAIDYPAGEPDKFIDNLVKAIEYCIDSDIKVISTSMGDKQDVPRVRTAIQKAVKSGITFSWFAYGENDNVSYDGVLNSSCIWDQNTGPFTLDRYIYIEGTMPENLSWGRSPTAPQVAGLAALVVEANPELTPAEIAALLRNNSTNISEKLYIPDMYEIVSKYKTASSTENTNIQSNDSSIKVSLNGDVLNFDVEPVMQEGRTLVPMRAIFEAMGLYVNYNSTTKTVIGTDNNNSIKLTIGSKIATVNGSEIELDVPAIAINGSTMVPTRFIAESSGAYVTWDDKIQTVVIEK